MPDNALPNDPLWPRAGHWPLPAEAGVPLEGDLALLGVPASRTSITPTGAHETPAAVRRALLSYSTFAGSRGIDVAALRAVDLGDVEDPDGPRGEERTAEAARAAGERFPLLLALGGDNSITYAVMRGLAGGRLADWGLVTLDAHHDLRDGVSNGSPVRRLIEAGLPGENVVQLGIGDFSNSAPYAQRAREYGITLAYRREMRGRSLEELASWALGIAGRGGRPVYVDLDVDVCDRAEVPACHAAAPGGIPADDLRELACLFGRAPQVRAIDITEIDADADPPDGRTVRLGALLVLEAAAGLAERLR